jgi:shikimate dehydrogenase
VAESLRLALLGDPVEHSLSPRIHIAALAASGVDGSYRAIRTDHRGLARLMEEMRSGSLDGANVTMPLKRAAADLCDHLGETARAAGSVNTLRQVDGEVEGHSTDLMAVESLLASERFHPGAAVLVVGAGATAEAVAYACRNRQLFLSARRPGEAGRLARRLESEAAVVAFGVPVAGAIVVNSTPLGMRGEVLPEGLVETASGLIDLPYGHGPTPAVMTARERGVPVVDGVEFLVLQAAASFSLWTGRKAPLDVMLAAARKP